MLCALTMICGSDKLGSVAETGVTVQHHMGKLDRCLKLCRRSKHVPLGNMSMYVIAKVGIVRWLYTSFIDVLRSITAKAESSEEQMRSEHVMSDAK